MPIANPADPKALSNPGAERGSVGVRRLVEGALSVVAEGEESRMTAEGAAKRNDSCRREVGELRTAAVVVGRHKAADRVEGTGLGTHCIAAGGGTHNLIGDVKLVVTRGTTGIRHDIPRCPVGGAPDCWFVLPSLFNRPSTWLLIFDNQDIFRDWI
jgi:hypothetical protein